MLLATVVRTQIATAVGHHRDTSLPSYVVVRAGLSVIHYSSLQNSFSLLAGTSFDRCLPFHVSMSNLSFHFDAEFSQFQGSALYSSKSVKKSTTSTIDTDQKGANKWKVNHGRENISCQHHGCQNPDRLSFQHNASNRDSTSSPSASGNPRGSNNFRHIIFASQTLVPQISSTTVPSMVREPYIKVELVIRRLCPCRGKLSRPTYRSIRQRYDRIGIFRTVCLARPARKDRCLGSLHVRLDESSTSIPCSGAIQTRTSSIPLTSLHEATCRDSSNIHQRSGSFEAAPYQFFPTSMVTRSVERY